MDKIEVKHMNHGYRGPWREAGQILGFPPPFLSSPHRGKPRLSTKFPSCHCQKNNRLHNPRLTSGFLTAFIKIKAKRPNNEEGTQLWDPCLASQGTATLSVSEALTALRARLSRFSDARRKPASVSFSLYCNGWSRVSATVYPALNCIVHSCLLI